MRFWTAAPRAALKNVRNAGECACAPQIIFSSNQDTSHFLNAPTANRADKDNFGQASVKST